MAGKADLVNSIVDSVEIGGASAAVPGGQTADATPGEFPWQLSTGASLSLDPFGGSAA